MCVLLVLADLLFDEDRYNHPYMEEKHISPLRSTEKIPLKGIIYALAMPSTLRTTPVM